MEECIEYFENGKIKSKGFKSENNKEGKWLIYSEQGFIFKEENYLNGLLNGIVKRWYENGNLAVESEYAQGISNGIWHEYYENGAKKEEGFYVDNKYQIRNFWIENGEQTLINGTGYKIEKYGFSEMDIYKQFFENSLFIKEEKISSLNVVRNSFKSDTEE
jgi:antitoxin component YwqK of YwqJK toxin-antitoxin module